MDVPSLAFKILFLRIKALKSFPIVISKVAWTSFGVIPKHTSINVKSQPTPQELLYLLRARHLHQWGATFSMLVSSLIPVHTGLQWGFLILVARIPTIQWRSIRTVISIKISTLPDGQFGKLTIPKLVMLFSASITTPGHQLGQYQLLGHHSPQI